MNARKQAADAIRFVRKQVYRPKTAWDTCVVAAGQFCKGDDAYNAIRDVCIKFSPVANYYLGNWPKL